MKAKKRIILVFTTSHADTLGNACRLEMLSYLTKYFETVVITDSASFIGSRFPECKIIGIEYNKGRKIPLISESREWRILSKIVNKQKADACFMFDDTSAVANYVKIPVFQYVHQFGNRNSSKISFLKRAYRKTIDKVLTHFYFAGLRKSEEIFIVSKPIIEMFKLKGIKNMHHVPHGLELDKFYNPELTSFHETLKKQKENGYLLIAYTGWVTENRGYQLMMDALKEAVKSDKKIVLVIAGADKHFSERITQFSDENGLAENIVNFGVIDVSLIPGILHYSDVCLSFLDDVPAYRISPPQKVIEYFAAGKPVICNKIETHEWLVKNGETGIITNMDAGEVAAAIIELKQNEKLYHKMASNAKTEAGKHDINTVYGNMVDIINQRLNGH